MEPTKPNNQSFKVQQWIVLIGIVLLVTKFAAYYITHSVAILTDALESIVNVVAGFISLYSLYLASKPRDNKHPYGHGKAEFLSAGIEGTLIVLAGVWILNEGIRSLLNPKPIQQLDTGILLVAISGAINFAAGTFAMQTGKKNNSMAIEATGRHLRSDAYSTAGLLIGLGILWATGLAWVDSAIALIFAAIIITTGTKIMRRSLAGIMDEADAALLNQLVTVLNHHKRSTWIDLHNLRIINYGNLLHVDCHLTLPWYINVRDAHTEVELLSELIKKEFGNTLEMFVHIDGCLPFSCKLCTVDHCGERKFAFEKKLDWNTDNIFENEKHHVE